MIKVGNRVRVIDTAGGPNCYLGDVGTVTHINTDVFLRFISVRLDKGVDIGLYEYHFELVPEPKPEVHTYKVGDKVISKGKAYSQTYPEGTELVVRKVETGVVENQVLWFKAPHNHCRGLHDTEVYPAPAKPVAPSLESLRAQQEVLNKQIRKAEKQQRLAFEAGAADPDWAPEVGEEFVRVTSEGNVQLTKKARFDQLGARGNVYHPAHFEQVKRSLSLRHQLMEDTLRLGRPHTYDQYGYMASVFNNVERSQIKVASRPRWMQVDTYEKAEELAQKYSSADMQLIIKYL